MTKKYILTGGPGSGKSCLRLYLESLGEYTVCEAAEDRIKIRQSQGVKSPWEEPFFQEDILHLQIQRESQIPENAQRVFIDRGIPDGLAYVKKGSESYNRILAATPSYDGVFLIDNLSSVQTNNIRREDFFASEALKQKLEDVYTHLGYQIHRVACESIDVRANNILKTIDGL